VSRRRVLIGKPEEITRATARAGDERRSDERSGASWRRQVLEHVSERDDGADDADDGKRSCQPRGCGGRTLRGAAPLSAFRRAISSSRHAQVSPPLHRRCAPCGQFSQVKRGSFSRFCLLPRARRACRAFSAILTRHRLTTCGFWLTRECPRERPDREEAESPLTVPPAMPTAIVVL
jgi:hypothetical protein